jgi:hypothetical protein
VSARGSPAGSSSAWKNTLGRALVDGRLELVGRRAVGAADLHQARARSPDEVVVAVAMDALHEHPVGPAVGLGQPVDAIGIEAHEDRRRAQGERRGGAARRVARLRAGRCRDARRRSASRSAIRTNDRAASAIASSTAGSMSVPPASVALPRALMTVLTPSCA